MEKEQARWIYKTMNEIRYFEEKVHKIFSDGKIPGFVHLYVGEEAVATGVMSQKTTTILQVHADTDMQLPKDVTLMA